MITYAIGLGFLALLAVGVLFSIAENATGLVKDITNERRD